MTEYQFILDNATEGTLMLEYAPDGWMPNGISWNRNMVYKGLFRKISVNELKFARDGRDYIKAVYDAERTQGNIDIVIKQLNKKTFSYDTIFTGIIDLTTYKIDDVFVTVMLIDTGFTEKTKTRDKLSVDLRALKTIEDESITPFSNEDPKMVLPDIYVTMTASWNAVVELPLTDTTHNVPLELLSSDFTEAGGQNGALMFENSTEARTIIVSGSLKGTITNVQNGYTILVRLRVTGVSTINRTLYSDTLSGTSDVDFDETINESINIVIGDSVRIETTITSGLAVTYEDTMPLFTQRTQTITGGEVSAYPIYDAFLRCLQIITGGVNPFYSTLFGRTDSELETYSTDGELTHLTKGLFIRGVASNNNTLPVNLKDLFSSMDAIFNIGLGVEVIAGEEKVRVESYDYFFDDGIIIDYSSRVDPDKIVTEVYPELIYNRVKVGFDKFDYEESQGLLEFNTNSEYSTIISNLDNLLDLICGFRADTRGITNQRQAAGSSEDAKGDDDLFIFATERNGADFDVLTNQDYDLVSGGFDAEQSFNLDYSPARNIRRHGSSIRAALELYTTSKLKWMYNEKNSSLITRKTTELDNIVEKADILISSLDGSRWIPEKHTVDVPFTLDDLNRVENNPRGIIKLAEDVYGWILQLVSKSDERTAELTLLRVNTDVVTPVVKHIASLGSLSMLGYDPDYIIGVKYVPTLGTIELIGLNPTVNEYISITPSSMMFDDNGDICPASTAVITIVASGAWTASDDRTWLSLSKTTGTGNDTITVLCTAQTGGAPERSGTVTVSLDGTSLDDICSVDQVAEGDTCI